MTNRTCICLAFVALTNIRGASSVAADAAAVEKKPAATPEAARAADPDLPQPFDGIAAQTLIARSPFTRAVNPAETLRLTGVAFIDGKPVVTLKDTSTNKTFVIGDAPNAMGWKLESAKGGPDVTHAEARIVMGSEVVTVKYSEAQLTPAKRRSSGGYMPGRIPTPEEFTGRDDKGAYVRGMVYLTDEDRTKMREVPRETREKFLEIVHDHRDMLFKSSHEDRAAFV